jgi:hypothetical protein
MATSSNHSNLESALRHVRDEWRVILIWEDALCIKQEGASEKKAQVNKMVSVYSSASHTVIYLP